MYLFMGHFPEKSLHDGRPAKALLQLVDGLCHFGLRLFVFREQIALHLIGLELADRQSQEADGFMASALIIQSFCRKYNCSSEQVPMLCNVKDRVMVLNEA